MKSGPSILKSEHNTSRKILALKYSSNVNGL